MMITNRDTLAIFPAFKHSSQTTCWHLMAYCGVHKNSLSMRLKIDLIFMDLKSCYNSML